MFTLLIKTAQNRDRWHGRTHLPSQIHQIDYIYVYSNANWRRTRQTVSLYHRNQAQKSGDYARTRQIQVGHFKLTLNINVSTLNNVFFVVVVVISTDSPILGYHSNLQKSFEVKCILMEDFELYRKDSHVLASKAINIGAICTANTTDSLLKVRHTINLLISVRMQLCQRLIYSKKLILSFACLMIRIELCQRFLHEQMVILERWRILPDKWRFRRVSARYSVLGRDRLHSGRKSQVHK